MKHLLTILFFFLSFIAFAEPVREYTIDRGETLEDVGRKFNMTADELILWNPYLKDIVVTGLPIEVPLSRFTNDRFFYNSSIRETVSYSGDFKSAMGTTMLVAGKSDTTGLGHRPSIYDYFADPAEICRGKYGEKYDRAIDLAINGDNEKALKIFFKLGKRSYKDYQEKKAANYQLWHFYKYGKFDPGYKHGSDFDGNPSLIDRHTQKRWRGISAGMQKKLEKYTTDSNYDYSYFENNSLPALLLNVIYDNHEYDPVVLVTHSNQYFSRKCQEDVILYKCMLEAAFPVGKEIRESLWNKSEYLFQNTQYSNMDAVCRWSKTIIPYLSRMKVPQGGKNYWGIGLTASELVAQAKTDKNDYLYFRAALYGHPDGLQNYLTQCFDIDKMKSSSAFRSSTKYVQKLMEIKELEYAFPLLSAYEETFNEAGEAYALQEKEAKKRERERRMAEAERRRQEKAEMWARIGNALVGSFNQMMWPAMGNFNPYSFSGVSPLDIATQYQTIQNQINMDFANIYNQNLIQMQQNFNWNQFDNLNTDFQRMGYNFDFNTFQQMPSFQGMDFNNINWDATVPYDLNNYSGGWNDMPMYEYDSGSSLGSGSGSSSGSGGNTSTGSSNRYKCSYCKNGRIEVHDTSVPTFGLAEGQKYCDECGRSWHASINHYHKQCYHCNGTGYVSF